MQPVNSSSLPAPLMDSVEERGEGCSYFVVVFAEHDGISNKEIEVVKEIITPCDRAMGVEAWSVGLTRAIRP